MALDLSCKSEQADSEKIEEHLISYILKGLNVYNWVYLWNKTFVR